MSKQFFKQVITQTEVQNRVVLVRMDYNVPLRDGKIEDDSRIRAGLSTILDLLSRDAKQIVLISHLGRPEARDEALSLKPVRDSLEVLLELKVGFWQLTERLSSPERVVLGENLRFWPGEESNSTEFAQRLVDLTGAELFVQDGFSVCHRETATTAAIIELLPSYASQKLADEYQTVAEFLPRAKKPILAVLGGAKLSDKLGFVEAMIRQADQIFVGGALAHPFLVADGKNVGSSLMEDGQIDRAKTIMDLAKSQSKGLFLPSDVKVQGQENKLVDAVVSGDKILDLGDTTRGVLARLIEGAGSVIWNGNLGYTEDFQFRAGSSIIVKKLAELEKPALIGGGDTVGFINQFEPKLDYDGLVISTGGGAMLDLLANGHLIGVDGLLDA